MIGKVSLSLLDKLRVGFAVMECVHQDVDRLWR
jgi:hypothetical protein